MKNENGVTLVSLATIVVIMIILLRVSVGFIGETGILNEADKLEEQVNNTLTNISTDTANIISDIDNINDVANEQNANNNTQSVFGYSVLTSTGVIIGRNLSSDALRSEAYNSSATQFVALPKNAIKYIRADESTYESNLLINVYLEAAETGLVVKFYDEEDTVLGKHIFYTLRKNKYTDLQK